MAKKLKRGEESFIGIIGDADTVTGFLLAGIGSIDQSGNSTFLIVNKEVPTTVVEDKFKEFITRGDVGIILINQHIANDIRYILDEYDQTIPTVLEIPSKNHKYNEENDSILTKVKRFFGE